MDAGGLDSGDERVQVLLRDLGGLNHVAAVQPPDPRSGTVSDDGTIGLATVLLDDSIGGIPSADLKAVVDTALEHDTTDTQGAAGLRVELTGDAVREVQETEAAGGGAEGVGMLAALVILLFLFGSFLAASMPLVTAVFAVGATFGIVTLASHVVTIPDYTPPVLILVGLGVGIDYALLVFARFRAELLAGSDRNTATATALDTAGRSVLFAGATVVIALLGLFALGMAALQGVALGVTLTILMTMLASLTLLPALLTVFGPRLERSVRRHAARQTRHGRAPRAVLAQTSRCRAAAAVAGADRRDRSARRAVRSGVVLRLGFADAGNDHPSTTSRQAYDLIKQGFGPGANGPLVVATEGDQSSAQAAYDALIATDGVAAATPPQQSPDGELWTNLAFATTSPPDEATADLVERLRVVLTETAPWSADRPLPLWTSPRRSPNGSHGSSVWLSGYLLC